jgi:branched-chain amino acid transport system substrate-binding protein
MFRMCGRDDDQSKIAAKFMKEYLDAKTVFIVDDKTTYSQGLADGVRAECVANGIEVLGHDHVNQGDKDFSALLTKAKDSGADVFYMSLQNHATGSLMAIQARRLGLGSQILTQDANLHPNFIKVAKDAAEGLFVTFGYVDENTPEYKQYAEKFTAQYGEIGAYATYAYDAATVLLRAIKAAGSTDPEKLRAEILKMDFQGASKEVKFRENGDSGSNYIVFQVKNGDYQKFWDPEKGLLQ